MQEASQCGGQAITTSPSWDAACFHGAANSHFGESQKPRGPPARDQSLPGQHGHSYPPPLPQPLWVLHPACFCRKNGTGASSPAPQSPSAPILLRALSTCRVYVGPTTYGDSSVPPTLAARAVESFRSRTFAAVGPQGKEQRSHFHLQPRWEWRERAREKTSVCKTRQSAGNFPLAFRGWVFFSLSLFIFLKRAGTASGQFKNNQATSAMCSPSWADILFLLLGLHEPNGE